MKWLLNVLAGLLLFGGSLVAQEEAPVPAPAAQSLVDLHALAQRVENPKEYALLFGDGLQGSGFIISYGPLFMGVASLHQFDGEVPQWLFGIEDDEEFALSQDVVFQQADIQAREISRAGGPFSYLPYEPEFTLEEGDRLAVVGHDKLIRCTLSFVGITVETYRSPEGPKDLGFDAASPFRAAGLSGAPVVLMSTGQVVGVMHSADDPEAAETGWFETLCLPPYVVENAEPGNWLRAGEPSATAKDRLRSANQEGVVLEREDGKTEHAPYGTLSAVALNGMGIQLRAFLQEQGESLAAKKVEEEAERMERREKLDTLTSRPQFLPAMLLILVGILAIFVSSIGLLVKAFMKSALWGIGVVLVPFLIFVYIVADWKRCWGWAIFFLCSVVLTVAGWAYLGMLYEAT